MLTRIRRVGHRRFGILGLILLVLLVVVLAHLLLMAPHHGANVACATYVVTLAMGFTVAMFHPQRAGSVTCLAWPSSPSPVRLLSMPGGPGCTRGAVLRL